MSGGGLEEQERDGGAGERWSIQSDGRGERKEGEARGGEKERTLAGFYLR